MKLSGLPWYEGWVGRMHGNMEEAAVLLCIQDRVRLS